MEEPVKPVTDGVVFFTPYTIAVDVKLNDDGARQGAVVLLGMLSSVIMLKQHEDDSVAAGWFGALHRFETDLNSLTLYFLVTEEEATRPLRELTIGITNELESIGFKKESLHIL